MTHTLELMVDGNTMNERINELWEQCKTINWSIDNPEYDHEKFAELIVQECFSICEDLGDKGLDGHYCADEIRKRLWNS